MWVSETASTTTTIIACKNDTVSKEFAAAEESVCAILRLQRNPQKRKPSLGAPSENHISLRAAASILLFTGHFIIYGEANTFHSDEAAL